MDPRPPFARARIRAAVASGGGVMPPARISSNTSRALLRGGRKGGGEGVTGDRGVWEGIEGEGGGEGWRCQRLHGATED